MQKRFLTIVLLLFIKNLQILGQDYLLSETLERVFWVKYEDKTVTGFLIGYNNSNYLITARHRFQDINHGDTVVYEILKNNKWKKYPKAPIYFHKNIAVDIAVIPVGLNSDYIPALIIQEGGHILGDEGFILGFPLQLFTDSQNLNNGFPYPLIKKVIFSGSNEIDGVRIRFYDGHNNPGFSGGPVLFKDRTKTSSKWFVSDVVMGYQRQENKIKIGKEEYPYHENSGIMLTCPSSYIKDIIDSL